MHKRFGILLGLTSFACLALLTFSFRDLSAQLFLMFFFTLSGLPLSTYLITKRSTYLITMNTTEEAEEDSLNVVGRFSI